GAHRARTAYHHDWTGLPPLQGSLPRTRHTSRAREADQSRSQRSLSHPGSARRTREQRTGGHRLAHTRGVETEERHRDPPRPGVGPIAESAQFVDCLDIGYPYAHISCPGARAVTGGEHGGRLTLGESWLFKRTLWSPPLHPGRACTTVACQGLRGAYWGHAPVHRDNRRRDP